MLKYGSDKPDLRNPILITDVTDHFRGSGFGLFAKMVEAAMSCAPSPRRTPPATAASSSTT
jgi:aspartyl-tRNA synthetase